MATPAHAGPIELAVYMCGTSGAIATPGTLVEWFYTWTDASPIADTPPAALTEQFVAERAGRLKLGYDGVGPAFGCRGIVFAHGLEIQIAHLCERLDALLRVGPVRMTCLGLSRGAVGLLLLAQRLAAHERYGPTRLEVTMLLFDPVPGNLLASAQLDACGLTTARKVMDVSRCRALRRVVAIYPYEPLPDIAFHAPVLPKYPLGCSVEEDVTLGCHQGAFYPPHHTRPSCTVSFWRVRAFLRDCGVPLRENSVDMAAKSTEAACLAILEDALAEQTRGMTRVAHAPTFRVPLIVRAANDPSDACAAVYLNKHHAQLARKLRGEQAAAEPADGEFALTIRRRAVMPWSAIVLVLALAAVVAIAVGATQR
jgi:hypothetical protein